MELLAEDTPPEEILRAVIWQILVQAGGDAWESEGRVDVAFWRDDADPGISGVRAAGAGEGMPCGGAWELSVGDRVCATGGSRQW